MNFRMRVGVLSLVMAVVATACGGGVEPGGTTLPGGQNTTPGTQGQATTSTSTASNGEISGGTVTIENETFEFEGNKFPCQAPDSFGAVMMALYLLGSAGTGPETREGLELTLAPEGGGPDGSLQSKIDMRLADARRWLVDERQESGRVDSWAIEGGRIVGNATFFSSHEDRLVPGSFDLVCGDG